MATGRVDDQRPGASTTSTGGLGQLSGRHSSASSVRGMSNTLLGPSAFGPSRARPTTQEIIAEAFGRRLHGLELLSVKKLNALNASAAKLEAHVASRAAAISRTSVAVTASEGGAGLGLAATPKGAAAAAAAAAVSRQSAPGDGGGDGEWHPPLSTTISVALPASAFTGGSGLGGLAASRHGMGHGSGGDSGDNEMDIAERGASVVRLLALQDRILHGALAAAAAAGQQGGGLGSPGSSQLLLPAGSRFSVPLPISEPAGGGGAGAGVLSAEEQLQLDLLGIKHDSKVAAAAMKLYRVPPGSRSGRSPAVSQEGDGQGPPRTPPPSFRNSNDSLPEHHLGGPEEGEAPDSTTGPVGSRSRRQLAHSHEFTTMARFIRSLQEGDEVSLAQEARNFARLNSSAPTSGQAQAPSAAPAAAPADLPTALSRAATAPVSVALPAISSPLRTEPSQPQPQLQPSSLTPLAPSDSSPGPSPPRDPPRPHKQLTVELPPEDSPRTPGGAGPARAGQGPGSTRGSVPLSHSPSGVVAGASRSLSVGGVASSGSSRLITPRRAGSRAGSLLPPEMDLGSMPTGQPRSKDLLDGLMKAVEMFVGAGVAAAGGGGGGGSANGGITAGAGRGGSAPGGRGGGKGGARPSAGAAAGGGRDSPFGELGGAIKAAHAAGEEPGGKRDPASPVQPYSGVFGSPERLTDRLRKEGALAVLSNPAGFREDVAAGEVAMYREIAERCRTALARIARHPRDALLAEDLQRQVGNLHYCRPFFVAPREKLPELATPMRPVSACAPVHQNPQYVQSAPQESVFLPRAEESESEDMVDTNAIRERQVRKDWNRLVRKATFRGLVGSDDPGAASGSSGTGLGHALDACLAVCVRHKDSLKAVFNYYSMMSPGINDYCFALGLPEWRTFMADIGLAAGPHGRGGDSRGGPRAMTPLPNAAGNSAAAPTPTGAGPAAARPSMAGTRAGAAAAAAAAQLQAQQQQAPGATGRASRAPAAVAAAAAAAAAAAKFAAGAAAKPAAAAGTAKSTTAAAANQPAGKARQGAAAGGGGTPGAVGGAAAGGAGRPMGRREAERQAAAQAAAAAMAGGAGTAAPAARPMTPPTNHLADSVFAAVNVEPEKRVVDGQFVLHRSLLRYEWYESLLRLATTRHVKAGEKFGSIAAALEHMWTKEILPALSHAAVHEPNMWRIVRLYGDPAVNQLFVAYLDVLTALYGLFSAASKNQLMHLSDWVGLLNTCGIIGDATGVTLHSAKLSYVRSLVCCVDEAARWGVAVCLSQCDFLEALARLAEELAPPPLEEVAEAMREAGLHGRELRVALEQPWRYYYNELPVELLVARRIAAAEAAAARSTTTGGEDSALPSLQNSTTRIGPDTAGPSLGQQQPPAAPGAGAGGPGRISGVVSAKVSLPGSPPGAAAAAAAGHSSSPLLAPAAVSTSPPSSWATLPKLSYRLEALLELLMGRLRDHWECDDNAQLVEMLRVTAASLKAAA